VSPKEKKVLVLVAPTAAGKTAVSLLIAQKLPCEILSADSRQVFRYLDIGTAKPTLEERQRVKHYFVDELNPDEDFNAAEFGKRGREIIEDIFRRGKVPLIVGGSGLYVRALVDGLFDGPSADDSVREKLRQRLEKESAEVLLEELRRVDPMAAANLLPSNIRRIIRALEVYQLTGKPISELQKQNVIEINSTPFFYGLAWERKQLYERINQRVDAMLANGLLEEVSRLKSLGYTSGLNSLQTVGYKEVFLYLEQKISHDEMVRLIKQNSRRYAKRQLTWFRADERIHWIQVNDESEFVEVAEKISLDFHGKIL
jgi:tRNA dimethylallyltransferase